MSSVSNPDNVKKLKELLEKKQKDREQQNKDRGLKGDGK